MASRLSGKPKPRSAKRTVLVVGEGATGKAFLTYLKGLLLRREAGFSVKIESADDDAPEMVIRRAERLLQIGQYDLCVIVMDTDLPWPKELPRKAGKTPLKYIGETPCVEGVLLAILGESRPADTIRAKRRFHDQVMPENRKTSADAYASCFPATVLSKRRADVVELDQMMRIMERGGVEA